MSNAQIGRWLCSSMPRRLDTIHVATWMSNPYSSASFVVICDFILFGMVSMDDDADDDDVDDDVVILVESDDIAYKTLLTEGSATPGTESSIQVCFGGWINAVLDSAGCSSECVYCNAIRPPKEWPQITDGLLSSPCRPRCCSVSMTSCTQDCMLCGRVKKLLVVEWDDEEPPWPRTSSSRASYWGNRRVNIFAGVRRFFAFPNNPCRKTMTSLSLWLCPSLEDNEDGVEITLPSTIHSCANTGRCWWLCLFGSLYWNRRWDFSENSYS